MMEAISNSHFTVHQLSSDNSETYFANNKYSRLLLLGLSSLHSSRLYCDVTLEAGNVSFPAHKVVLAATSVYFRAMFSHDFQESLSNIVKFPDVSPAIMKIVLDFMYSGKVNISDDSVKDILKMAHMLDLKFLIEACYLHLKRNLTLKSAVATLHLSKVYGFRDITTSSLSYIVKHFKKLGEDILKLTSSELLEVIENDKLAVSHEDDVLRAVTNWLEFNKEENNSVVFNIMETVRISECSREEIRKLLSKENQVLLHSGFMETIEYCMTLSHTKRSYLPELYMVGGEESPLTFGRLDLKSKEFSELPALPNRRESHGCALVGGKLYVLGGGSTTKVDCYDPDKNCWLSCSPTSKIRNNSVIVELGGMIYACGGRDVNSSLNGTVERYDPEKDEWTEVASMNHVHGEACGAVVNGRIYVIGGYETGERHSSFCEYYDPVENSWQSFTPIPAVLISASASAVQGALFVTGGWNGSQYCNQVHRYDVETGAWSSSTSMPISRGYHISCAFSNKLYVIGGVCQNSGSQLPVLTFDITSANWSQETILKSKKSSFAGCFDL